MMSKKRVASIAAGLVAACAEVALGDASISRAPMQVYGDDSVAGEQVPRSYAKLWRNDHGIAVKVRTRDLPPGIVTLMWLIFNNPEFCLEPFACDVRADENGDNTGDPRVEFSWVLSSSDFASKNGLGSFGAGLREGDRGGGIITGPGLIDSHKAEVHLVIVTRGQAVPEAVHLQLSKLLGTDVPDDRHNAQIAIHRRSP